MTDRQTDKQNGMTIRLTLCERDAINAQFYLLNSYAITFKRVIHLAHMFINGSEIMSSVAHYIVYL